MPPRSHQSREAGVVSLFTVIFFTILLSVLTLGFARIMISERRQSTDEDLTTRAYYAAESGVEDAKRALKQYYPNPADHAKLNASTTSCSVPQGYNGVISATDKIGYSCMLMDLNPSDIQATLPGDDTSLQWAIRSQNDAAFNKLRISWHSLSDTIDGTSVAFRPAIDTTNLTYGNWNSGGTPYPAMLRMQIFGFPRTGSFGRAQTESLNNVGFLNPTNASGPTNVPIGNLNSEASPTSVSCTSDTTQYGGYACQATIDIASLNTASNYLFLRLKGLYDQNGTKVKVELLNGGNVVDTQDAQAMVDVTGYAGDVFRRVQSRVSLDTTNTLLPEFGLESGDNICKHFEITKTTENLNECTVR
jgi:Tfp pilus assembly protein PilX